VALVTTKYPILIDRGFWVAAHEARTDWAMFLGSLFLIIVGADPLSVDARLNRNESRRP
jgi:putative oxidoreductase